VLDAELGCTRRGAVVEANGGLPGWQTFYFNLLPSDATHAKAKHFRDSLLSGPTPSHRLGATTNVRALPSRQDSELKPFWVTTENIRNSIHANDVDADLRRARRVLSPVHHSTVTDFARFFG
jgi:hypothetical protein